MTQTLLRGQRVLPDGETYTFNEDLRLDHLAELVVTAAPDDLTTLSDDDLTALRYAQTRHWGVTSGRCGDALGVRINAERARREIAEIVAKAERCAA